MARGSADPYGSEGSVPNQQPLQGTGAGPLSVRATPEDFGAQVGQGIQKVGQTAEDISLKYANMAMETAQNTAEVNFIKDAGDLKAKYMQLEGSAAVNARPQYEAEMEALQQKHAEGLPLIAMHGYNVNTTRSLRFATSDYAGYAAGQQKQALLDSGVSQINIGQMMAKDPFVAVDDNRFGEQALAPIAHGHQTQLDLDHPGLKTDENGVVSFDESKPEGQNLKAQFENNLNHSIGLAYEARFNTLASTIGPIAAYDKLQKDKDEIPPDSVVRLEASLQPQVFNAQAKNVTSNVMTTAAQEHRQNLTNPSSSGSNAYNLGNVKTASGAASNTQDFVNPSTPVDGAILTANNLRTKNYEGKTLDQIGHTWTSTDKDAWVKNVSAASGISKDTVPDLNDPATMQKLLKGISVAEGKDKSIFTDDVISQGVTAALAGKQPQTSAGQPQKPYATNPNGSPLTLADYASTHREQLIAQGDAYADATMPGSLQFKNAVRQRITQQINTAIQDQSSQYKQDNNLIMRAFNGDFTKGKHPTTLDELSSIQGMKDVLDRASVHSPDFVRELDSRLLTAASRGENKDAKEYGDKFLDLYHQIHPSNGESPAITDANQLNQYVGEGLTLSGRNQLQKEIESTDGSKSLKADTYKAVDGKISKKNPLTGIQDPDGDIRAVNAHSYLRRYIICLSDDELLNPKNPKWVGNIGLTFARTSAQVAADLRKANGGGQIGENTTAVKQLIDDLDSGKLKGDAGLQAIKQQFAYKKISRETASELLIKYGYAATSNQTAANPAPTVPRPE